MGLKLIYSKTDDDDDDDRPRAEELRGDIEAAVAQVLQTHQALLGREDAAPVRIRQQRAVHAVRTALLDWGYTTDMLGLAIIGCAGSAWCMGANPSRRRFDSLPWILQSDAHIDRLMDDGERALEWARRQASGSRSSSSSSSLKLVPNGPSDEQRARLAELRRQLAARVAQR